MTYFFKFKTLVCNILNFEIREGKKGNRDTHRDTRREREREREKER